METNALTRKRKIVWTKNKIQLFAMASLGVIFLLVFAYTPMFGVVLAFKDGDKELNILEVILYGDWVGFENFTRFFFDYRFKDILFNTIGLNLLMLCINFPAPIIFALILSEIRHKTYSRWI